MSNEKIISKINSVFNLEWIEKVDVLYNKVKIQMDELREYVNELENMVDDELWPLPKFWEMLFIN